VVLFERLGGMERGTKTFSIVMLHNKGTRPLSKKDKKKKKREEKREGDRMKPTLSYTMLSVKNRRRKKNGRGKMKGKKWKRMSCGWASFEVGIIIRCGSGEGGSTKEWRQLRKG